MGEYSDEAREAGMGQRWRSPEERERESKLFKETLEKCERDRVTALNPNGLTFEVLDFGAEISKQLNNTDGMTEEEAKAYNKAVGEAVRLIAKINSSSKSDFTVNMACIKRDQIGVQELCGLAEINRGLKLYGDLGVKI